VDPLQHDHTNLAKVLGHTDNAMSKASADARLDSLKGHKSQNSQPPKEVAVEGPWANAVDPHDLLPFFLPVDTDAGDISDRNVYRSMTPTDTPELSMSGSSKPNSAVSPGVEFSINMGDTSTFDTLFTFDTSPSAQELDLEEFKDFYLFGNSPFENAWSLSKSDPIHLAGGPVDQKPTAPSGTNSRASRIFKCWVETCSHFNEGFLTLKQRRTHYEKVHSHLILTCQVEGCKASPFLREQDRTKHENRMHSAQKVEEPHTEGPADVNEIVEINHISVGNLFQIRLGSER
jgi:hypothetical protein